MVQTRSNRNIPRGACPPVNLPVNPPNESVAQNMEVPPAPIPEAPPAHAPAPSPGMTANEVATIMTNMMQAHAAPGASPVFDSPPVPDKFVEDRQGVKGVKQHGSRKRPMNSQEPGEPNKAPRGPYPDSTPTCSDGEDANRPSQSA
ncbi:predicted GPI-anchored protein 58 [Telopea speciosissima]|uniref:predicted GPI-anchored protein 58 n=1 Tax=Telopea speciosissima TaxID=54955 RepID=UPI001CC35E02|nr:predicted GPI-anchored protein 58 [Telopea speciosissima]